MGSRASTAAGLWAVAVVVGLAGAVAHGLRPSGVASGAFLGAVAILILLAVRSMGHSARIGALLLLPGAGLMFGGLVALDLVEPASFHAVLAIAMLGAAVALGGLSLERGSPPPRGIQRTFMVVVVGVLGTGLVVGWTDPAPITPFTGVAYVTVLTALGFHAAWRRRAGGPVAEKIDSWEGVHLAAASVLAVAMAVTMGTSLVPPAWRVPAALALLKTSLILNGALVSPSAPAPRPLRLRQGGLAAFYAQSLTLTLLINLVVFAAFLQWPWVLALIMLVLLAWLALAVSFEYATVWHAHRTRGRYHEPPPTLPVPSITIVIVAFNEESNIERTVRSAVAAPNVHRVVVAVSAKSVDRTWPIVEDIAAEFPDRLDYLVGMGASKADDVNAVWARVTTDFVLILDADETIDADTLPYAVAVLEAHEDVAIVQGRKAPRDVPLTSLDAFIAVERRFSTLLDHTFQSDLFGAAHFAGSGALMRKRVFDELQGLHSITLTEDIEFTMRLYRAGTWRIVYEPRFVVREESPHTFASLVRQRGRWARGWTQVYRLHMRNILRQREAVGAGRAFGLFWQLLTSISAPWSVFFPALLLASTVAAPVVLPSAVALVLAATILPSRLVSWVYANTHDPAQPERFTIRSFVRGGLSAYAWLVIGWLLQLQALYLELAAARHVWLATRSPSGTAVA